MAQRGADDLTYSQRRQKWLNSVPQPKSSLPDDEKRLYFSAWLQKGIYNDVVSEGLRSIIGDFWMTGGRSHHGYLAALLVKFGSKGMNLIDPQDELAIHGKYAQKLILSSGVFEDINPNKQMWAMAGVYIYTHYFNKNLSFPIYGRRVNSDNQQLMKKNWPSFSEGGNTYAFGDGPYKAKQLAEDYIKHQLKVLYLGGNREMDSLNYHRAYVGSMLLLYDMAEDQDLRRRARMGAELAMLDAIMDYGGSEWGGTLGRTDFSRMEKESVFPFYEFFGVGQENDTRPDIKFLYTLSYEPPELLVDLAVLKDERDDYFHFHKENHNSTLKNASDKGKWNYVTPFYNLGSNVGGINSGWQATVRGNRPGRFIRFWINASQDSDFNKKTETRYLGHGGRQFRNALFVDTGDKPIYHERLKSQKWDSESVEDGWHFKRLNNVFVAIRLDQTTASVEFALKGVDYDSKEDFKTAIKRYAFLTEDSYTTSKGVTIEKNDYCGFEKPGDCPFPFKRMETQSENGQIIQWSNNVMTVSYNGKSLVYDFKKWKADDPPITDRPPDRPRNVRIRVGN